MSVSISVGLMTDLEEADPEAYEWVGQQMAQIAARMVSAGLPPHAEPDSLTPDLHFSGDLPGYSGLHKLRRLAAWLALNGRLPDATLDDPLQDEVYIKAYPAALDRGDTVGFRHLIDHSDAEGFYVPVDFPLPLPHDEATSAAAGPVGSVPRLADECRAIAQALQLPIGQHAPGQSDLGQLLEQLFPHQEPPGLLQRLFGPRRAKPELPPGRWRDFPDESYACIQLMRGCEASMRAGAAMAFV